MRFSDNQVDVKTGTIRLVGEFDNPDRLLVPGMFVRVRARVGINKDALLVPQRAVADLQGRNLIAIVDAENKVSGRGVGIFGFSSHGTLFERQVELLRSAAIPTGTLSNSTRSSPNSG